MRKTRNKEGEHSLIGFIALCQSRSSKTKRGILRYPASVLAPESALGSLPSVALSSAQAIHILIRDAKPAVALVAIEGVEHLVPNACTVAGFEVITIGRFCGDNRGYWTVFALGSSGISWGDRPVRFPSSAACCLFSKDR
jgi:hypothetical protein